MKSPRTPNRRPTHPGAILRNDVLPAPYTTQLEVAARLGVGRVRVSKLLHEKRAMTPEMALHVGTLLRSNPENWLRVQEAVDLWEQRQNPERFAQIEPLPRKKLEA